MRSRARLLTFFALVGLAAVVAAACSVASAEAPATSGHEDPTSGVPDAAIDPAVGINNITHVIVIMQENRSFDHYFGTYPGPAGIPMKDGRPTVCVPDPVLDRCVRPFHESALVNQGGPHDHFHSTIDVNSGRMDGFVRAVTEFSPNRCADTRLPDDCGDTLGPQGQPDVMSYMTRREIPNYWTYAKRFVLQDHLYAPADSWTLPAHLFLVSAWAARCADPLDPMSCASNLGMRFRVLLATWSEPSVSGFCGTRW
jgi:phospholipase C